MRDGCYLGITCVKLAGGNTILRILVLWEFWVNVLGESPVCRA